MWLVLGLLAAVVVLGALALLVLGRVLVWGKTKALLATVRAESNRVQGLTATLSTRTTHPAEGSGTNDSRTLAKGTGSSARRH